MTSDPYRIRMALAALGLALLAGGGGAGVLAPAHAQVMAGVDTLRLAVPSEGTAEAVLRLTNEGTAEAALALRLGPLSPPAVRPGTVLATAADVGAWRVATSPDGRVFVASHSLTAVYTAELEFLYEFQHPRLSFESTTQGVAFDENNGTLWWLDTLLTASGWGLRWARLVEGDTLGHATGRRIDLPLGPGVPNTPIETSGAWALSYDAGAGLFFYLDHAHYEVWAADTLGAVAAGYPRPLGAYAPPEHDWDAYFPYGLEVTGAFLETAPMLIDQGEDQARRVVVTGRDGRDWGAETPLPAFPGFGTYAVDVARGRGGADTLLYLPVRATDGSFVAAVRAAPLPPAWLRPDTVRTRLPAGEAWDVHLTVDARDLEPGTYTAAVRAVRTAGALQQTALDTLVTVPVVLEVGAVADEPDPAPVSGFTLGAPYPNPTAGLVTVPVEVANAAEVALAVYDALGRCVAAAPAVRLAPGAHRLALDASGLAAGVYVIHAESGAGVATRRLTVVR